jgi:hypothetical protein
MLTFSFGLQSHFESYPASGFPCSGRFIDVAQLPPSLRDLASAWFASCVLCSGKDSVCEWAILVPVDGCVLTPKLSLIIVTSCEVIYELPYNPR